MFLASRRIRCTGRNAVGEQPRSHAGEQRGQWPRDQQPILDTFDRVVGYVGAIADLHEHPPGGRRRRNGRDQHPVLRIPDTGVERDVAGQRLLALLRSDRPPVGGRARSDHRAIQAFDQDRVVRRTQRRRVTIGGQFLCQLRQLRAQPAVDRVGQVRTQLVDEDQPARGDRQRGGQREQQRQTQPQRHGGHPPPAKGE